MRLPLFLAATIVIFLASCAGPSRHWSPYDQSQPANWHGPFTLLLRYDADNDGKITRRELEAGLRQDFWQADSNRDGLLDAEEVRATNLRRIRIDQSTAIPLIDWNHDGYVDFNEFAAPMRSLFEQYDADGDGVVTLSEMHIRLQKVAPSPPTAGEAHGGTH